MEWQLKEIQIEKKEWGEYTGKYVGKIKFANNQNEAFMFNLNEEQSLKYLSLISETVGVSADQLGQRIKEAMKSLPNPTVSLQLNAND